MSTFAVIIRDIPSQELAESLAGSLLYLDAFNSLPDGTFAEVVHGEALQVNR